MKSIITKGVILVHNDGTFFIEAKLIDGLDTGSIQGFKVYVNKANAKT